MNIKVTMYFLIKTYLFICFSFFTKESINKKWIKSSYQEHLITNADIFFQKIYKKRHNLTIQSYYFLQKKKNSINKYIVLEKNKLFIKNFLKKKMLFKLKKNIVTFFISDKKVFIKKINDNIQKKIKILKKKNIYENISIFYKNPMILIKKSYDYFYLKIKKKSIFAKYIDQRADKYFHLIKKISEKYNIDIFLVLAIIKIESDFNPYAISKAEALGLMQIVQTSAGRDVFRTQGKSGYPSKSYLLNPKNNINIGIAYLSLLQNTYLSSITNPLARLYIVIVAYNSGLHDVFHIFSDDKNKTILIINKMKPSQIYSILINDHPYLLSRKYLYQVIRMQKIYKERFQKVKKCLNL